MKASVVIPVYNPGPNLRFCLDSLRAQTLPHHEFEVVLVDDGSTDGTAGWLDQLAQTDAEFFRVIHIPNSGWPGRPRNVGIEAARGTYVQFVDNDDELAAHALEALVGLGAETTADIVIGKMASDFRGLNHPVFRETQRGRTLAEFPFEETLTPHKMFRRDFLMQHDLRFPEGPRHLEDQLFVMQAYVRARSISLLGGRPCYFYQRRRGVGRNAGDIYMEPREYYANLAEVLGVVATSIPSEDVRNRVFRRFYRVEILSRVTDRAIANYDDSHRRELVTQARNQAMRWLTPEIARRLPAVARIQLRLLLADDVDSLVAFAATHSGIGLRGHAGTPEWHDGSLHIDIDAELLVDDQPLVVDVAAGRVLVPDRLSFGADVDERTLDDPAAAELEVSLVSRANSGSIALPAHLQLQVVDHDRGGVVRITGTAVVDPRSAGGGEPLDVGLWDLRLRMRYAGWSRTTALRPRDLPAVLPARVATDAPPVIPYWTQPNPTLALDVGEWSHSLVAQLADGLSNDDISLDAGTLRARLPATITGETTPDFVMLLEGPRVVRCPATLHTAGAGGALLEADVPTHDLSPGRWNVWLRGSQPGAAPARRLDVALEVAADRRSSQLI